MIRSFVTLTRGLYTTLVLSDASSMNPKSRRIHTTPARPMDSAIARGMTDKAKATTYKTALQLIVGRPFRPTKRFLLRHF